MRRASGVAALALAGVAALTSAALAAPLAVNLPPAPTRWVTDEAGLLSPATRDSLDARLEAFERQSGHQILVYIAKTTGGIPLEELAVKAFEKWRVGRKGIDDGLVLFVFSEDRRLRIEVGYGLEGTMPDALAGRIVNDVIAPRLAEGHPDDALTAGVDGILAIVGGTEGGTAGAPAAGVESAPLGARPVRPMPQLGWGEKIVIGLVGLVFLVILITNPRLALWILFNVLSAAMSGGGGGGGSRGSFSSGGGRSGGGGASGSW